MISEQHWETDSVQSSNHIFWILTISSQFSTLMILILGVYWNDFFRRRGTEEASGGSSGCPVLLRNENFRHLALMGQNPKTSKKCVS